ncbi:MAG: glycosyltransferase [Flavobacteriales bacterium]|nr:glycosyltransferase [Flavobacteriales bacterium]
MRIAVVILNWNGKSFLEKFLPIVVKYSQQATVYVADNASTDDSVSFIQEHHPEVKLIETGGNLGFAGGYNKALENLNEAYFVLLNSDVEVTENWLQPIIDLMDKDRNIAACQPKILQYDHKTYFEYAGAAGGFIDRFGYPFCRGRIFETTEEDHGQYNDAREVFWATGACMFVRGSVYKELGGLDDDFFAHMEEIDLCWRIKRAGYKVMVEPQSVVYHVGGGTLQKSNPFKTFLNFRNGLELLLKNLPKGQLLPVVLVRMVLDGAAAFKFLVSGNPKDFWAIFRAHMAVYSRLRKTLGKRSGKYETLTGIYHGSIVVEHFLKGKKKFSELSDKF